MSIANILLTQRQQRILAPLLLNPERRLRVSELLALSGKGHGATQKHIQNFFDAGLLLEHRQGNQRYLQINQKFPIYEELRSICIKSFGLRETLAQALEPLRSQITEAFVFGSVASQTDRADSDIDLMVIGAASLLDLMEVIADLETKLKRQIHTNLYEESDWQQLITHDPLIKKIIESPTLTVIPNASSESVQQFNQDGILP